MEKYERWARSSLYAGIFSILWLVIFLLRVLTGDYLTFLPLIFTILFAGLAIGAGIYSLTIQRTGLAIAGLVIGAIVIFLFLILPATPA